LAQKTDAVTGAFGYIGRHITERLLRDGRRVKTITTHPDKPNPFGPLIHAQPYNFQHPGRLIQALQGVDCLYNTYWIRFEHSGLTYQQAVQNTEILFQCAVKASVRKIVHISVTHASTASGLPYYRGKGLQEDLLKSAGLDYAIVRPTLVFGKEDILVNNIAWLIRKFPIFPIPARGQFRLQPVYVRDLASIAVSQGLALGSGQCDAVGPETFSYSEFAKLIASAVGRRVLFVPVPPFTAIALGKLIGLFLNDVILTRNELRGLMNEHLTSSQTPNGPTKLSDWLQENRLTIGSRYSSELDRHFRWSSHS
jgi:NADH dehydrogenase